MSTHVTRALLLASIFCFAPPKAQAKTPQQDQSPTDALIETLRRVPQSNTVRWFASTDPEHRNEDYLLLKPGETRRIPLASGELTRLWCTALEPGKITLQLQNGGAPIDLLRGGRARQGELYAKAFTWYPTAKTPAATRQLKSGATLIARNGDAKPNKFFYQASVSQAKREIVKPLRFVGYPIHPAGHTMTLRPGTTFSAFPMSSGTLGIMGMSGIISEIRISPFPVSYAVLSRLKIRIYRSAIVSHTKNSWQMAGTEILVEAPLLALIGHFGNAYPARNSMASFDGKTVFLRWPMPYDANHDALDIEFAYDGAQPIKLSYSSDLLQNRALQNPPPYLFHAVYGSSRSQKGKPIPILKAKGSGFFAGLNLSVAPRRDAMRRTFSFLEGNETIEADGVKHEGTGTEDYFNSAWYYPDAPFDRPFHGMTRKQRVPPQVDAYRLMIRDAVPFSKSLNFAFEHGNRNKSDDLEWRWVAFWYQKRAEGTPDAKKPNYQIADNLAKDAARERVLAAKAAREARVKANRQRLLSIWIFAALVALASVLLLRLSSRRPPGARGGTTA